MRGALYKRADAGRNAVFEAVLRDVKLLSEGAAGIDAGLTLTKVVWQRGRDLVMSSRETAGGAVLDVTARRPGVTGACAASAWRGDGVPSQEIEAAARGTVEMLAHAGRPAAEPFVLALLGTGTAFAAVRDGRVSHLGGCALGGGSFIGIARRLSPGLTFAQAVAGAARGDRRYVDLMVGDAYPDGIGRISGEMTAAHLARAGGSTDDALAGILNLHGESLGQIGASRARMAGCGRMVLAGGFAQENPLVVQSIAAMSGMFGVPAEAVPHPAYAGALGAALIAAEGEVPA
jgi:type II pantothenate kinase